MQDGMTLNDLQKAMFTKIAILLFALWRKFVTTWILLKQ